VRLWVSSSGCFLPRPRGYRAAGGALRSDRAPPTTAPAARSTLPFPPDPHFWANIRPGPPILLRSEEGAPHCAMAFV